MRSGVALFIVGLTLGGAACGGGDDGGAASTGPCPSDAVTVRMADIKFDPQTATANVGEKICWVNEDSFDHNAVAESGADFKSELFGKGKTFTTTVDKPGTVKYECTVHPGMTGEIRVQH